MEDWVHRVGADVLETNCSFLPGKFLLLRQLDTCVAYYVGDEDLGDLYVCSDCTVIPATCLWAASAQLYLQDLSVGSVCAIIPAGLVCRQRLRNYTCRTCLWAVLAQYRQDFLWATLAQLYLQDVPVGSVYNACRTCLWDVLGQYLQDLLHNTCRTCL